MMNLSYYFQFSKIQLKFRLLHRYCGLLLIYFGYTFNYFIIFTNTFYNIVHRNHVWSSFNAIFKVAQNEKLGVRMGLHIESYHRKSSYEV